jgi:hypothetical protein
MKAGLLAALLALALVAGASGAATASAPIKTTLAGMCSQVNKLDHNGALASATVTCTASGPCKCGAAGTKLTYSTHAVESGSSSSSLETGTIVATGPQGTITLVLSGKRSTEPLGLTASVDVGKGTWKLGKVTGYTGIQLAHSGTWSTTTKTVREITGSLNTVTSVAATVGCWRCSAT